MSESQNQGIKINGKQQIIEMLRFMEVDERNKLIKQITLRNPSMARELLEQSFNFKNLMSLDDDTLSTIFDYVNSSVLGIALKTCSTKFQRRALSIINRTKAQEAYQAMRKDMSNPSHYAQRAQNKVVNTAITLSKKQIINLTY